MTPSAAGGAASSPTPDSASGRSSTGRVITVSASYGAGGSVIAEALARRLGVPLLARATAPPGALADRDRAGESLSHEERKTTPVHWLLASLTAAVPLGPTASPPSTVHQYDELRGRGEAEIASFVAAGGGVILGRAAAVVLGKDRAFHVRLDGPEDRRVTQGAAIEHVDLQESRARLRAADAARTAYVRRLYRVDPANPTLYHLMIDTTAVALQDAVELILSASRSAEG
jgi:cytidylate kinase